MSAASFGKSIWPIGRVKTHIAVVVWPRTLLSIREYTYSRGLCEVREPIAGVS